MEVLTVGSVVSVKGITEKRMITGYLRGMPGRNVFDYASVPFPIGAGDPTSSLLFNADAIEQVFFEGFKGDDYDKLVCFLQNARSEVEKRVAETADANNGIGTDLQ